MEMHYFGPPPTFIPVKKNSSYAPVEYASAIANHSALWPHPLSDYLCPFTKSTSYSNCDKVKFHLVFVQPGTISVQHPVLYRGLGDHTFYNMYIYIFITYYMRFLYIFPYPYVTVSEKRAHFGQYFKIELLVLKGRVALKQ